MAFAISPTSTVELLQDIPFDVNYENTMYFSNRQEQDNYFANKVALTLNNYSYQRTEKGSIKIGSPTNPEGSFIPVSDWPLIKSTYSVSYMRFKNDNFENKWFYAFVDRIEYINNATVELFYHIDVIQTWLLDCIFNQCMIDREHTSTDIFGEHTLPEGLESGPYRSVPANVYLQVADAPDGEVYMNNRFEYQRCVVLACTLDNNDMSKYVSGVLVPGAAGIGGGGEYYSGVRYYVYPLVENGQAGIYQVNISGSWNTGDKILIDDVMTTLTAGDIGTTASVANAVASNVNINSAHFNATASNGVITLTEKTGNYGYGFPDVQTNSTTGYFYNYIVRPGNPGGILDNIHRLNSALLKITEAAKSDAIVGLFMMPYEFFPKTETELYNGAPQLSMRVPYPTSIGETINGYIPRNKKLFCSPYNILFVTNNTGNDAEYRFEDFSSPASRTSAMFRLWGNVSMNPGMYCAPLYYNGNGYATGAVDDELTITGFPMCSYAIDSFKAWLAQNAGTIGATVGTIAAGWAKFIGGAVATGGASAALGSVAPIVGADAKTPSTGLIASTLGAVGQLYDHSRKPPQSHGQSNGNLSYQAGQLTFSWYYKQIKPEYAEIIDKFFDMYGYTTHRVGIPLLAERPCYTYTKTIGCSIKADIPNDIIRQIETIFDKGIRFWRTSAVFGNFDPNVNNNMPV